MIARIVSGGQSGVDRAALDIALELGVPCGGWCPKGWLAEDGAISQRYPLVETPTEDYAQRTTWNVRDSDGTLVLNRGAIAGGTAQTVEDARKLGKPCLVVDLDGAGEMDAVARWLIKQRVGVLNVAGPRESKSPGVYRQASEFLRAVLVQADGRGGTPWAGSCGAEPTTGPDLA